MTGLHETVDPPKQTECPVEGCSNLHPRDMLMCRPHWFKVSRPTRNLVWRTYRNQGVLSSAYQKAREKAIAEASA